jgi:hypothetical protein
LNYLDTEELSQKVSKLRAVGSESALEEAARLEREAEKAHPEALGIDPNAKPDDPNVPAGSVHVEGTPVETPVAPELPSEPQVAEQPPTAEERLGATPPEGS